MLSDWMTERSERARREQAIRELCQEVMHRARYDPAQHGVTLTDIGLLTYRVPQSPKLSRFSPVMTDTRWLRPFLEMDSGRLMPLRVQIRILDSGGNVLFTEELAGKVGHSTRIVTQNWLPLENIAAVGHGRWSVAAYLEGRLMAIYQFGWEGLGADEILEQLHTDGEINGELQDALRRGKFRPMSLDELLSDQED